MPPPAEYVERLLEDLSDYVNGDEHPALVQAAVAHAQFETSTRSSTDTDVPAGR